MVVGDHDGADAVIVRLAGQERDDLLAALAVQGSRGLVDEQQLGRVTSARAMPTRWRSPPESW